MTKNGKRIAMKTLCFLKIVNYKMFLYLIIIFKCKIGIKFCFGLAYVKKRLKKQYICDTVEFKININLYPNNSSKLPKRKAKHLKILKKFYNIIYPIYSSKSPN